jgi:hypothetical protein
MKSNFNNCSDIKGLRFFTKEICPYYCGFLHTKKDSGGASIHRIDESFPLTPFLIETALYLQRKQKPDFRFILKMASGETIRRSYECLPLLSLFLCVKNDSSKDRFV